MIVLIVESVPPGLRGQLSKWLLEPQAGVFVGNVSGAVRELLWEKACKEAGAGNCTLVQSAANEQGYIIRTFGETKRVIEDWEGLFLVRRPRAPEEETLPEDQTQPHEDQRLDTPIEPAGLDEAESMDLGGSPEDLCFLLWGKSSPYKSLIAHMIDAGAVAQSLLSSGCMAPVTHILRTLFQASEDEVLSLVGFLAAMHDHGKCHPLFQGKGVGLQVLDVLSSLELLQGDFRKSFRHEKYSERIFRRLARGSGLSRQGIRMAAATLRLHHQGKVGEGDEPGEMIRSGWHAMQDCLMNALLEVFPADLAILSKCTNLDCAGVILSALIILADWLASGNERFLDLGEARNLSAYFGRAQAAAQEAVMACGLYRSQTLPATEAFSDLWTEIPPTGVRPLQQACVEACRIYSDSGLVIVEAPMGEGKTEAAVYVAAQLMKSFRKEGMYIALPTAATSNQMHSRISSLLSSHNMHGVRLLHGMAWMIDRETSANTAIDVEDSAEAARWMAPLRRGLLAPYAVGTIDQAMLAVMPVKYGFLRLLGIANKVLVLDEVHAYDAYMSEIIERLLNWCAALGVPVVLLSATLPTKKREAFLQAYGAQQTARTDVGYPMITCVENGTIHNIPVRDTFIKRRIAVSALPMLGCWAELANLLYGKVRDGGCVCVIVNTVLEAQQLYQQIRDVAKEDEELWQSLFHARFPADRRQQIESECLSRFGKESLRERSNPQFRRPHKAILVATQVVEQSLDLDFDEMISAIAPIDLLLQRAGRLHRHEGRTRPAAMCTAKLTVLAPATSQEYGSTGFVYAPWILQKTERYLGDTTTLVVPEGMRHAIESVYDTDAPESSEGYKEWYEMVYTDQLNAGLARANALPQPTLDSFFCTQQDATLLDEDDAIGNLASIRTRLGERSTRIALLDEETFKQAAVHYPNADLARRVLLRSVTVPSRLVTDIGSAGFLPPREGDGLLKGVMLLAMINKEYAFESEQGSLLLREDPELGILFEGGKGIGRL